MNMVAVRTIGSYIMLLSIIAAVFRQHELYVYGGFIAGFCLVILPINIRNIPFQSIFAIIIPLLAINVPLPIPKYIPGLVRLGGILIIWAVIFLGTSSTLSFVLKKWGNNDARKKGK